MQLALPRLGVRENQGNSEVGGAGLELGLRLLEDM